MEPIEAYYVVREACKKRPELKYGDWNKALEEIELFYNWNPYQGMCYIATEVFCYLVPEARRRKMNSVNHHFAVIDDKIWDLTAEQFSKILDYKNSYTIARKPLTERAKLLLEEVEV